MSDNTRGLGISYLALDGVSIPPERFRVEFTKLTASEHISWDLTYSRLDVAREMAEAFVDDNDADSAVITSTLNPLYEEYRAGEWTIL